MNLNHPMPVMKPKPATFILACALLVLVLAYVKGCAPAPAVGGNNFQQQRPHTRANLTLLAQSMED
jgi:hypothetical protein